jgi:transmembrane sensor
MQQNKNYNNIYQHNSPLKKQHNNTMEENDDILKKAIAELPTYPLPDKNWDVVEHNLNTDVTQLPNTKIPRDIWNEIEAQLPSASIELPLIPIPIDIWDKIETELDAANSATRLDINSGSINTSKKRFGFDIKTIAAAAGLAILLAVGYKVFSNKNDADRLAFDGSKTKSMQWEDGSVVYSTRNAMIEYPAHFAANSREVVQTNGEAFYEITKNPDRPFIIHSQIANVRVVGTSFSTNVSDDSLVVLVKTGKVSVGNGQDSVLLLPNEKVVYYADGSAPSIFKNDTTQAQTIASKPQIISYSNASVVNIFEEMKTKFNVQIHYSAPQLAQTNITGRFIDGDVKTLITNICEASGLTVEVRNNEYYIK